MVERGARSGRRGLYTGRGWDASARDMDLRSHVEALQRDYKDPSPIRVRRVLALPAYWRGVALCPSLPLQISTSFSRAASPRRSSTPVTKA